MDHIQEEAEAFDKRIVERVNSGFIPDLRNAVKCEYFYKSFFREPFYMSLYMGQQSEWILKILENHSHSKARILDVGCGPGIFTLEIARNGYDITGIDISSKAIASAQKTLDNNKITENFGALKYYVKSFEEITEKYDVILFAGVLHHLSEIDKVVNQLKNLLNKDGVIICHEPIHENWREQDAAQVAFLRLLLSSVGIWYEDKPCVIDSFRDTGVFDEYVKDVHDEYIFERDKTEKYQSPHDNETSGTEILEELNKHFNQLVYKKSFSFIYRFLGGLRGDDKTTHKIAELLTLYDQYCVEKGFLMPNYFLYAGAIK